MQQFDVVRLRSGARVVILQSDLMDHLPTRLVAPLIAVADAPSVLPRLNPVVSVEGADHIVAVHLAATISVMQIVETIRSLAAHEFAIKAAIDLLISGF